jgi:hypothetical protein
VTARPLRGEVALPVPEGAPVLLRAGIGELEALDLACDGGVQGLLDRSKSGGLKIADVTLLIQAGLSGAAPGTNPTLDDARAAIRAASYPVAAQAALQLIVVGLGLDRGKKDGGGVSPATAAPPVQTPSETPDGGSP